MIEKADDGFTSMKPTSAEVLRFDEQEPNADWERSLDFLLEHFPQRKEGSLQYLIEGGAAIALISKTRKKQPKDLDLLVVNPQLKQAFQNSLRFDAKTLSDWFELRRIQPTDEKMKYLITEPTEVVFRGKVIYILRKPALAYSKLVPYVGRSPREEDKRDVGLLDVSQTELDSVGNLMRGK